MARVLLKSAKLTDHFWAEAISTACYTSNRVFFRPHTKSTPYEIWKGKKPNIKHLWTFGSKCYIHKDRESLGKFDGRGDVGIFLGYSMNSKAYKVFNSRTKKIMESTNVVVNDSSILQVETSHEDTDLETHEFVDVTDIDFEDCNQPFNPVIRRPSAKQVQKDHSFSDIIRHVDEKLRTQKQVCAEVTNLCYVSLVEPKSVKDALADNDWILAMQEELNQFKRNYVWYLVPCPKDSNVIGTKWIFQNKTDEKGQIMQIEGLDFDETFAPVVRLESVRLLLSIACHLRFKLHQMDVKSAFLNGVLQEEVYVGQPTRFQDPIHHNHVYRLKKALYGLNQAPRAWYDRLSTIFFKNGSTIQWRNVHLSNKVGNIDDRKSTTGGCFYIGKNLVSWSSKKQNCVSLSTVEAEYIATGSCCIQLLWMKQMLNDYGIWQVCRPQFSYLHKSDGATPLIEVVPMGLDYTISKFQPNWISLEPSARQTLNLVHRQTFAVTYYILLFTYVMLCLIIICMLCIDHRPSSSAALDHNPSRFVRRRSTVDPSSVVRPDASLS
ncbi:unnamed protein product [Prunus brigantina]